MGIALASNTTSSRCHVVCRVVNGFCQCVWLEVHSPDGYHERLLVASNLLVLDKKRFRCARCF